MQDSSFSSGFINDSLFSDAKSEYQLVSTTRHSCIYKTTYKGKLLILKTANPDNVDSETSVALLRREYQILSELDHPFIIRTWGLRNDPQIGECLILDYVDGTPLDKFLELKPTHNVRHRIINELLDAVAYLHAKQIVHKDLKPSNILITTNGEHVKLIDFGFSDADSQMANNLGCTNRYASPEQLNGETPDYRSDIFTLGKIIREIEPYRYLCATRRCLKVNPDSRYLDVASLIKAINLRNRLPYVLLVLVALLICFAIVIGTLVESNSEEPQIPLTATPAVDTLVIKDTTFVQDTIEVEQADPAEPVINEMHGWYRKAQRKALDKVKHLKYPDTNYPIIELNYFSAEVLAVKRHYQNKYPEFSEQIERDYLAQYTMLYDEIQTVTNAIPKDETFDDATFAAIDQAQAKFDSVCAVLNKNPKSVFQIIEQR